MSEVDDGFRTVDEDWDVDGRSPANSAEWLWSVCSSGAGRVSIVFRAKNRSESGARDKSTGCGEAKADT